jgi:hypothetical protein
MAYALAAFARPRLKLTNPGIMTALYPRFWALYNTLPEPKTDQAAAQGEERNDNPSEKRNDMPKRKRVRLSDVYSGAAGGVGEAED